MTKRSDITDSQTQLRDFLVHHLKFLYCNKSVIREHLSTLKHHARFGDLQQAIIETCEDIDKQMERMRKIFGKLKEEHPEQDCDTASAMLEEAYGAIDRYRDHPAISDLSILYYLLNMESIETASFRILKLSADHIGDEEIKQMLRECFDEADGDRHLVETISALLIGKQ